MRLVEDAPKIAAALKAHPQMSDAVVVAFPDRRAGTGLYAFVETAAPLSEHDIDAAAAASGAKPPERLQVVAAMPRTAAGDIRTDILQLVAMNQVDLIDPLVKDSPDRELVSRIVAGRRNLRDRFAF